MGSKKPRHTSSTSTSIRITLTKEIADTLVKKVSEGLPLFTDEQYQKNEGIEIPLQNGVFVLKPATYRQWMSRRVVIPETKRTLYQSIHDARHAGKMKKHIENQKSLVAEAQNYLQSLQKLPLGTLTRRKASKSGYNDRDGDYSESSEEVIETPINPAMVAQKRQGAQFILQSLDPAYKKGAESNVNVMINLGDLRRHKEKAEPKEIPKEDYTVTQ